MFSKLGFLMAAALLLVGCSPAATPNPTKPNATTKSSDVNLKNPLDTPVSRGDSLIRFEEVAERVGIRFTYRNGEEADQAAMPESLGGGVALFDFDGDGRLDVALTGGGSLGDGGEVRGVSPVLFRGVENGRFVDVTQRAGIGKAPYYSHGTAVGDIDGDGFSDLLITGYGGLLLFHNCGDGTFEETAQTVGLTLQSFSTSAAFGDIDGDAILDLYITNYVNWSFENHPFCKAAESGRRDACLPRQFDGLPDALYLGNGDGTFREVSSQVGLRNDGKGLGVLLADLDLDADLDIYVANDTTPNFLYRNDGTGQLSEVGISNGAALSDLGTSDGSMGVDAGDFDLDGRPDLWVTNFEMETMGLYRNDGEFAFQHVSRALGLRAFGLNSIAFGTTFIDADRDGDEDLFVAAGHVNRYPRGNLRKQHPLLFENIDGMRFHNVADEAGLYLKETHLGRGTAIGDLDDDGDQDLVVSHVNDPAGVLRNESKNGHHWIGLRLIGTRSHRDAVGTVVRLTSKRGKQLRLVKGGTSYLSAGDPRVFFGLGEDEAVSRISITWPSGTAQEITDLPIDRYHVLHEPK